MRKVKQLQKLVKRLQSKTSSIRVRRRRKRKCTLISRLPRSGLPLDS